MQFPVRASGPSPQLAPQAPVSTDQRAETTAPASTTATASTAALAGTDAEPQTLALPSLRPGGPERKAYKRGRAPDLSAPGLKEHALEELDRAVYAASSLASVGARRKCIRTLLGAWGTPPYPISEVSLRQLGASLKAGSYRSAPAILSQYRVDGERRGESMPPVLLRMFTDISRSCLRGVGPARKAQPLPFEQLKSLPGGWEPWVAGGPVGSRNAVLAGAWWLLRETELSNLRASLVDLRPGAAPTASLTLPASKSDTAARGVTRAHACVCSPASPSVECPAHVIWDQFWILKRRFGARFAGEVPDALLPMFPDRAGQPVSKRAWVKTLLFAAARLKVPAQSPDGAARISGHTLRHTGAQGLCRMGLDLWAIQLIGRWGSAAVRGYVAEASVSIEAALSRRHLLGKSLRDLSSEVARHLSQEEVAELSARAVETKLREIVPDLKENIRATLAAELRQHLADVPSSLVSSSSSSSRSSSPGSAPIAPHQPVQTAEVPLEIGSVIASTSTRRRHRVLVGPSVSDDPVTWTTSCGWKFGLDLSMRPPRAADLWCRKCWPASCA